MADPASFDIQGLDAVMGKMDSLSYDVRRKGGRFAMRKAVNVVRDAAQANARQLDDPETAENIAANIAVRFSPGTFRRTGDILYRVGVLGGAAANGKGAGPGSGNPGGDTWYWRFIEFGRGPVKAKDGALANADAGEFFGRQVAAAEAQPFMRRALAENVYAATDEFVRQYDRAIVRAIKRAEKRGRR